MIEFPLEHRLLTTTDDAWQSILEDIHRATKSIDFEQFYFIADEIGNKFGEALIERARNGVKIRCHFDSAGAFGFNNSKTYHDMIKAGIEIKFFNWLVPFTKGFHRFGFFRNHRRILIIDFNTPECIVYHGGICIGEPVKKWLDLNVRLSIGKSELPPTPTITILPHPITSMQKAFDNIWSRSESKKVSWVNIDVGDLKGSLKKYYAERKALIQEKDQLMNADVRLPFMYITQSPMPGKHQLYRALINRIGKATKHITITTPYFLPTHRLMRKLVAARRRGVLVTIIIPHKTDHPFVDIASHTYMNYFLDNKIDIYRHPKMIHGKGVEIDSRWATIGTMNMDGISLRYNFESGIVSGDDKFVADVERSMNMLRDEAKLLTQKDWDKRSLSDKIAEVIMWPFRKLL
ncbi:MAG: phospholipase D-like domain-containing protein [bacterium]